MKISTYNVNSVRARLPNLLKYLREDAPDIVLLQELKCIDEQFPTMEIEELGYNIAIYGQKTYNGVAILSKHPFDEVIKGLPTFQEDSESRYIEAVVSAGKSVFRVASIYVPNGQEPDSEKFKYKLTFLEKLQEHAKQLLNYEEVLVLGGDYNVAPEAIDVFDPIKLKGTTCFHPEEWVRLRSIINLGYTDGWRAKHPDTQGFSWWHYMKNGFALNHGYRIDHLLLSPHAADKMENAGIATNTRGEEKASDHAPVWCTLTF